MGLIPLNYFTEFLIFQMDSYKALIVDMFAIDMFIIDKLVNNLMVCQNCFMFMIFRSIDY